MGLGTRRRIICFFGPDGAGKTTLSRYLGLFYSRVLGKDVYFSWLRGTHTIASVFARFLSRFRVFRGVDNPYYRIRIPSSLKSLWVFVEILSVMIVWIQRYVFPALIGKHVIGERGLIDFVAWLALTLRDPYVLRNPLVKVVLYYAMKNSVNIYVYADPKILSSRRRDDLSPGTFEQQLMVYNILAKIVNAPSIDTSNKNIQESFRKLLSILT